MSELLIGAGNSNGSGGIIGGTVNGQTNYPQVLPVGAGSGLQSYDSGLQYMFGYNTQFSTHQSGKIPCPSVANSYLKIESRGNSDPLIPPFNDPNIYGFRTVITRYTNSVAVTTGASNYLITHNMGASGYAYGAYGLCVVFRPDAIYLFKTLKFNTYHVPDSPDSKLVMWTIPYDTLVPTNVEGTVIAFAHHDGTGDEQTYTSTTGGNRSCIPTYDPETADVYYTLPSARQHQVAGWKYNIVTGAKVRLGTAMGYDYPTKTQTTQQVLHPNGILLCTYDNSWYRRRPFRYNGTINAPVTTSSELINPSITTKLRVSSSVEDMINNVYMDYTSPDGFVFKHVVGWYGILPVELYYQELAAHVAIIGGTTMS